MAPRSVVALALAAPALMVGSFTVASPAGGAPAGSVDPIVIAVEAPLTGSQSSNGKDMLRGVKLAVAQQNARGGVLGRPVQIVRIDDRADADYALASVDKAVAARAIAIIGPYNSSVGVINLSAYLEAGIVPLRMTSATATEGFGATTQPMVSQTSPVEIPYLASIAKNRVVMLVDPSSYTTTVANQTGKGLEKRGIDVVQIMLDPTASSYDDAVAEALALDPDVVYSSTYYPEGTKIAQALAAANTTAKCFMNLANVDNAFVSEVGVGIAQSCTYSGVPAAGQFPGAETYVAQYKAAFGKQPDVWGSFTYDSALLLFDAMERAGTTRFAQLTAAVLATKGLKGATGTISINPESGNRRQAPMFILTVNDAGDFVIKQ
ncbi:MAG: hypothetical protein B7C55_10535 [Actinomycetales bacterium mxb001]|nr:MAG: hypothetical protein B7C55_10535 [Actinomycetales bacterium mxb001]